jgi:NagD protein
VLVLSGGTKREDLTRYAYQPDLVISSLAELLDLLEESRWQTPRFWSRSESIALPPAYAMKSSERPVSSLG